MLKSRKVAFDVDISDREMIEQKIKELGEEINKINSMADELKKLCKKGLKLEYHEDSMRLE